MQYKKYFRKNPSFQSDIRETIKDIINFTTLFYQFLLTRRDSETFLENIGIHWILVTFIKRKNLQLIILIIVSQMSNWIEKIVEGAKYLGEKTVDATKYIGGKTIDGTKYIGEKTAEGAIYLREKTIDGGKYLGEKIVEKTKSLSQKTPENIDKIMIGGGGVIGTSGVLLPAIGFTSSGVKLGSIAAFIQSQIGNVAANSSFSYLQYFAAVDGGTTLLVVGGTLLVGGTIYYCVKQEKQIKQWIRATPFGDLL